MSEKIIDEIGQPFGKEGLRFLFLFKIIKKQVQKELEIENRKLPADAILNDICARTAKELLISSQGTPTEEQIGKSIMALKTKINQLKQ